MLGMGFMGKTHTFAHAAMPFYYPDCGFKTELVGVCNRSEKAALDAKESFGYKYATTDEDRLFADPEIDAVHICTPNEAHFSQVKKALAAGKGLTVMTAFNNRFSPAVQKAKELVAAGRLGELMCFRVNFLHCGSISPDKPMAWRFVPTAGTLLDLGSHALDLIYFLIGRFDRVFAQSRIVYSTRKTPEGETRPVTAEDHICMTLTHSSGAIGTVEASKIATGADDELLLELHGTKGALRLQLEDPNVLKFFDMEDPAGERGFKIIRTGGHFAPPGNAFPPPISSIGWLRVHCASVFSFYDCIARGVPAQPDFADGAHIQKIMEKARESARSGVMLDI